MNMHRQRWSLVALVACASLTAFAQEPRVQPDGGDDPALPVARARYAPESWPRGERRVGFDLGTLALDGFVGGELEPIGELVLRRFSAKTEGASGFHVELLVTDSVDAAQQELLSWLASVSSVEQVPRAAELGIDVGDVAFAGRSPYGPEHPHWVGFVLGNLAIRLVASDLRAEPRPSLAVIARRIDALASLQRALAPDELLPRPTVEGFALERTSVRAGEIVRIELAFRDALAGKARPHFTLVGPATGYVERGPDGALLLHTTGAGELELQLALLGSNGTFARSAVRLDVAPE